MKYIHPGLLAGRRSCAPLWELEQEAEQYLVTAVLRPGNAHGSAGAVGILRRLIAQLREVFPKAKIRVRLDGVFAAPEVLGFLDCEPKVEYLLPTRRPRKSHKGTALRHADRTDQLYEFLSESVSRLDDRGSLRVDAGVAR